MDSMMGTAGSLMAGMFRLARRRGLRCLDALDVFLPPPKKTTIIFIHL
jgi:hypothetical protein